MTIPVRGSRTRVIVEAHESHSQKHSISREGLSSSFPLSPVVERPWSDLTSNSKSFPSCKYRKTEEHSGLAHFEITVSEELGYTSRGNETVRDDSSRGTSQHGLEAYHSRRAKAWPIASDIGSSGSSEIRVPRQPCIGAKYDT
jgi:hypothetical protein